MWTWSLGLEDRLEKEMATYYSILAWKILWTEENGRLWSMGLQRVRHDLLSNKCNNNKWSVNVPFMRCCQEAQLALYFPKVTSVSSVLEFLLIVARGLICWEFFGPFRFNLQFGQSQTRSRPQCMKECVKTVPQYKEDTIGNQEKSFFFNYSFIFKLHKQCELVQDLRKWNLQKKCW